MSDQYCSACKSCHCLCAWGPPGKRKHPQGGSSSAPAKSEQPLPWQPGPAAAEGGTVPDTVKDVLVQYYIASPHIPHESWHVVRKTNNQWQIYKDPYWQNVRDSFWKDVTKWLILR